MPIIYQKAQNHDPQNCSLTTSNPGKYLEPHKEVVENVSVLRNIKTNERAPFSENWTGLLLKIDYVVLNQVLADGLMPSTLYGGEHLLRLCAKLPYLVPISSATPEAYAMLQAQLAAFVDFLTKNKANFFLPVNKYIMPKVKTWLPGLP